MLKRSIDVVSAILLLTLSIPFLALAAIFIKLDSRGPVIFRQTRVGRGFQCFQMIKLRTMSIGGAGPAYTLGYDPRITTVGGWLRRLKIDELPQLWNILRGDMSFVGPRPVIPELAREFYRDYLKLLKVRPGLTDPASVKYCAEAEILKTVPDANAYFKDVITPDKIRISTSYIEHANVWSDLKVLAETGLALLYLWFGSQGRYRSVRQVNERSATHARNRLATDDWFEPILQNVQGKRTI